MANTNNTEVLGGGELSKARVPVLRNGQLVGNFYIGIYQDHWVETMHVVGIKDKSQH
jgi:hypothetical protein